VIPTFNRRKLLLECLESLSQQTLSGDLFEVIVVDDGSTDGTEESVRSLKWKYNVTFIKQENAGPAQARNAGVAKAQGRILAFTEDDVIVRRDWLANAVEEFDRDPIDLLEGRTVYRGTNDDVRRFEPEQRPSFIPCNLFIRSEVFVKLGGYDRDFYMPGLYFREDADFGFRALKMGFHFRIARNIIVEHPEQFVSVESCVRHVRRYFFDPLLYKRHASLYRSMIEVKTIFGLEIHRPQHYVSLVYGMSVLAGIVTLLRGNWAIASVCVVVIVLCGLAFQFKYLHHIRFGRKGLVEIMRFLLLPAQYLNAFVWGCFRFRSFGAIV
jgi:glycosyltransferase involved in cell wall biosynthesis